MSKLEARVVCSDGVELSACSQGVPGAPALLFAHGWSQSKVVWQAAVDRLAAQFQVITYDLRGHGDSDRPSEQAAYDGRWQMAQDAEAVLNCFGVQERAVAIGWSFGALAAADVAVHLGRDRVCGVVVVSGSPDASTETSTGFFGPVFGEIGAMTEGPRGVAERSAVEHFLRASYVAGEWDAETYRAVFEANMKLTPSDRGLVASRPSYENAAALSGLGTPVLFIHGEKDGVYLANAAAHYADHIAGAEARIYAGVGHWPFLEQPDRFADDIAQFALKAMGASPSA